MAKGKKTSPNRAMKYKTHPAKALQNKARRIEKQKKLEAKAKLKKSQRLKLSDSKEIAG